jgi:phosphomannomutase
MLMSAFSNGMINVSPVGRNASIKERGDYEKYDIANNIRPTMIKAMKEKFPELALTYSIGGQISFDVFPTGWDKTYCLRHVEAEKGISGIEFKTIHFFGDKAYPGGNDWEIYEDKRTTGHKVTSPEDTMNALKEIFAL